MSENITNNPSVPTQVVSEVKFPRFINNLGIIPTSYKDSMDYYENLAWLCKYLEETVIPTVNQNGKAVQELQGLYIQLNDYVTHYFDNLDVQEEINNKLDDMVESGTLQEIIADYLDSKAVFGFDTVADMKTATNLINGSYAKTLGFHSVNDGGSATYKIRTITNDDVVDNMFIIEMTNDNSLIAELIVKNPINPLQLGAYGDGTHDDLSVLQTAINTSNIDLKGKSYYISNVLNINNSNRFIEGNNATIISNGNYAISCEGNGINAPKQRIKLDNITISLVNQKSGLHFKDTYFLYLNNINILNMDGNNAIGIDIENGFNHTITNSRILGNLSKSNQIGLNIHSTNNGDAIENMTNCNYNNLLIQRFVYGVKCNFHTGANTIVFDNNGFSSNTYSYYLEGTCRPLTISNSRIEVGEKTGDTYGIYIDNNIQADIDSFNIYNIKFPIYNISTNDLNLNGQMAFTGGSQSPKYNAITSNGNVCFNSRPYYLSTTYNLYNSSSIGSGCSIGAGFGFTEYNGTLNSDTFTITSPGNYVYKLANRVFNLYGTKGTEIYIYADTEGYKIQSATNGSTTSQFTGSNIDVEVNKFYKIKFLDNNKWTVVV